MCSTVGVCSTMVGAQYRGGCAVLWWVLRTVGDILSTVGDIMSTMGVILSTVEDTQYHGGIS